MSVVAINWLAVIVAAVVKFAIGAVWFTALFGKRWRALQGVPEGAVDGRPCHRDDRADHRRPDHGLRPGPLLGHYGATDLWDGVLIGFMAWLGFVATIMVGQIFYEKKKPELIAIGAGYQLVGIVVMGAILAVWH